MNRVASRELRATRGFPRTYDTFHVAHLFSLLTFSQWYRRRIGDEYGLLGLNIDALDAVLKYPDLIRVGGNTGEPNTFVGLDLDNLTGGVFNAKTLLEGNNLMCFGMQFVSIASADILKGLVGNVLQAVSKLTDALNPILQTLSCPQVSEFNQNLFDQFPGAGSGF